jgi:hypothetical protein
MSWHSHFWHWTSSSPSDGRAEQLALVKIRQPSLPINQPTQAVDMGLERDHVTHQILFQDRLLSVRRKLI